LAGFGVSVKQEGTMDFRSPQEQKTPPEIQFVLQPPGESVQDTLQSAAAAWKGASRVKPSNRGSRKLYFTAPRSLLITALGLYI